MQFMTADETEMFVWPSIAGVTPSSSNEGLASYVESLMPVRTVTSVAQGASELRVTDTSTCEYITFDSFQISDIVARFRLPSGAITNPVPIIRKATI